jgi:uncharacterized protein DUF3108
VNALAVVLTALQTAIANPLPAPNIPFSVGEKFDYTAKMGMLKLGSATIEVVSIDTVRGVPAWYFRFGLAGGMAVFKINSTLESWTSLEDFHSLRFRRDSKENSKRYFREYEIFPDSGYYRQRQAAATTPTTAEPLDDASLLYFIRITPLVVGQSYKLARHFMPEVNPIVVNVLERETVTLPGGSKIPALVINPVVGKESGLFSKRADARIWITDDARRIPVQIRSTQPWGTITMRLEKMTAGTAPR